MNVTDKYMSDIRLIVDEYRRIEKQMSLLLEKANLLNQQKQEVELALAANREKERNLIIKIKEENGEGPNFFEILQQLNN